MVQGAQSLRLRRIINDQQTLSKRLDELVFVFTEIDGYPTKLMATLQKLMATLQKLMATLQIDGYPTKILKSSILSKIK